MRLESREAYTYIVGWDVTIDDWFWRELSSKILNGRAECFAGVSFLI